MLLVSIAVLIAVLVRTVEVFGSPSLLLRLELVGRASFDGMEPLRGFEGVSDDGVSQNMNQIREKTGLKHIEGFGWEDVHNPARHQSEMFGGSSKGLLNRAGPPCQLLYFKFCLGHGRSGDFLRCQNISGSVF